MREMNLSLALKPLTSYSFAFDRTGTRSARCSPTSSSANVTPTQSGATWHQGTATSTTTPQEGPRQSCLADGATSRSSSPTRTTTPKRALHAPYNATRRASLELPCRRRLLTILLEEREVVTMHDVVALRTPNPKPQTPKKIIRCNNVRRK